MASNFPRSNFNQTSFRQIRYIGAQPSNPQDSKDPLPRHGARCHWLLSSLSIWCMQALRKLRCRGSFLPRPTQCTRILGKTRISQKTFSIKVLLVVDHRFRAIWVWDFRRPSDGVVYAGSCLEGGNKTGTPHVPLSTSLPGASHMGYVPFVMVGDASFPTQVVLDEAITGTELHSSEEDF